MRPKSIATVVVDLAGVASRASTPADMFGHHRLGPQRHDLRNRADECGFADTESARDDDLGRRGVTPLRVRVAHGASFLSIRGARLALSGRSTTSALEGNPPSPNHRPGHGPRPGEHRDGPRFRPQTGSSRTARRSGPEGLRVASAARTRPATPAPAPPAVDTPWCRSGRPSMCTAEPDSARASRLRDRFCPSRLTKALRHAGASPGRRSRRARRARPSRNRPARCHMTWRPASPAASRRPPA